MKPIFISYRRDDNISAAKLLKSILESELGKDTVFLDTTTIEPGEKWRLALKDAVNYAKVVIAFIGPFWKGVKYWTTNNKEDNKLLKEDDWVRLELETALTDKRKKIIPMIFYPDKLEGFRDSILFKEDTLPPSLLSLCGDNNKTYMHEKQFEDDLRRTILEISRFIKHEDILAELPLPDFDPKNPLDHLPEYPFKGLDFFTERDARIFFGRNEQIKEIYYLILNNPLALFYGQSGIGKSSLLFAGLKRRMENKGWSVQYFRREPTINLAEELNACADNNKKNLVILDQIEEIYINPSDFISLENEKFQLVESLENALKKNIHILLSFREEYLAKIQELFDAKWMPYGKMPLRHMQVKGVLEAIEGVTKSPQTKYNYKLSYENKKDVPQKIAYLVLNDEQSHVAPLLQLLLRKLWDRVINTEDEREITEKLFDEVKSQSLKDMLNDQIELLRPNFSKEIDSGLVLDVLYFFTTSRGTSASHFYEELKALYNYNKIFDLTEALKKKYLLTDVRYESLHTTRLAHDSLAPLIRELYAQSNLSGQRASRLLESKRVDIEADNVVEFSELDIAIIDAGKYGMRKLTDNENRAIEESRQQIQEAQRIKKVLSEQKQKEEQKKRFEKEEIDSLKIHTPLVLDKIIDDIDTCLLITGDKLILDSNNVPIIKSVLDKTSADVGVPYDKTTNLFPQNDKLGEELRRKFYYNLMDIKYNDDLLKKISRIPFKYYIQLSFDNLLRRTFKNQNLKYSFDYYYPPVTEEEFLALPNEPLLYNLLGSIDHQWRVRLTEDGMSYHITAIQNDWYVSIALRRLIQSGKTIIFLGVNWDVWYIQSLLRYITHDGDKINYTVINNITIKDVSFLKNFKMRTLDADFIEMLYNKCDERGLLRG